MGASGLRSAAARGTRELAGAERTLVAVRWVAVLFAVVQVQVYDNMPYPPGIQETGFALAGLLALSNLGAMLAVRRARTDRGVRLLAVATLVTDAAVVVGYVWLYTFDHESTFFLMLFILPAEAALKFRVVGALGLWGTVTALYVAREMWGEVRYAIELSVPSISYRMGILLLVSLMFGLFARRLGHSNDELAAAVGDLEREERWRSALIDMLAHDFRSPVGSATSSLLLVSQRMGELSEDQLRGVLEGAVRQNRRALTLADDILALARASHGRLELRREDVAVRQVLDCVVADLAMQGTVTVECPAELRAHVDPARFEQIVTNLLSNSCKHGRPPVTVTASALPDHGVELRVADSGDGVPEEEQAGLFQQFASGPRADSVGLGLWLVAMLADAHGGGARYLGDTDRPTFVVRLPGVMDEQAGGEVRRSSPAGRRRRP